MEEKELVRVNTRIGADLNDWLDQHSARTGMSKSVIMMMATENYRREQQVMVGMENMGLLFQKLEEIEKKIQFADKQ